jgi:hypothetical protein
MVKTIVVSSSQMVCGKNDAGAKTRRTFLAVRKNAATTERHNKTDAVFLLLSHHHCFATHTGQNNVKHDKMCPYNIQFG